jgi:glycosyltransferase involved in cell wall biosynthesis
VLTVYNAYLNRGGEDEVFEAESDLLEANGHEVLRFRVEADELRHPGIVAQARLAVETIWSRRNYDRFRRFVRDLRPDIVHFHNTFPLLSPSVYAACHREGAKVVQTLHNYRMICPATTLFRDGRPCEDCVGLSVPWPSVLHGCYHDSRPQTAVIAAMLGLHRARGTWNDNVDLYLTPSEFARAKLIQGGLPPDKVAVKPNFVDYRAGPREGDGDYMLLVGRLVEHKGVATVLEAWRRMRTRVPLVVIGDGPLADEVERFAARHAEVTYLGRQPHEAVLSRMRNARALLFPSAWYETFGITVVEAFACGLPVIASAIGPVGSELVEDGRTGLLFAPGDSARLASLVEQAWSQPEQMRTMGDAALQEYRAVYTPERNYQLLEAAYALVLNGGLRDPLAQPEGRQAIESRG